MIFAKNEEKLGAYCMHSLLKAGNQLRLTVYMPLVIKWGFAKIWRLHFGSLFGQFVQKSFFFFAKNKEKSGAYCMYSLLKDGNLLRLTAYILVIMKSGVA